MLPAFKSVETQNDNSGESIEESSSDFQDGELSCSVRVASPLETASSVDRKGQTFFSSGKQKLDLPLGGGCCSKAEDDQSSDLLQTTTPKQNSSWRAQESRASVASVIAAAPTTPPNAILPGSPPQRTAALQDSSSEDEARAFLPRSPAAEDFDAEEASTSSGSSHTSASPSAAPEQPPKLGPYLKSVRVDLELTAIRKRVQSDVDRIIESCHMQGTPFNDGFPHQGEYLWLRPEQIQSVTVPPVGTSLIEGADPSNVRQATDFKDCWQKAPVWSIAGRSELLEVIFVTQEVNREGVYGLLLYEGGRWNPIIINDRLPCDAYGRLLYSAESDLWCLLLQKGFAKLYGGYRNLELGYPREAFTALTGAPCRRYQLASSGTGEDVWSVVKDDMRAGNLMTIYRGGSKQLESAEDVHCLFPLHSLHAYSLDQAQEDKANGRYVELHDPYGAIFDHDKDYVLKKLLRAFLLKDNKCKVVWDDLPKFLGLRDPSGAIFDCCKVDMLKVFFCACLQKHGVLNTTWDDLPRFLELRDPSGAIFDCDKDYMLKKLLRAFFSEDGTFKIFWDDLPKFFTHITSCKPYDSSTFVLRTRGELLAAYSSSLSAIHVIVKEDMEVDFALWRHFERGLELSQKFVFDGYLLLFRLGGQLYGVFYLGDLKASAFRQARNLLTLRHTLKRGMYLVVCVSLQEWTPETIHLQDPTLPAGTDLSRYELTMHSRKELWARHVPLADGSLADAMFKLVEKEGVKLDARPDALAATYSLTTYPAGVIFAAENRDPTKPLPVSCDVSESKNVTTTRGAKKTTDVVPPMRRQVLQAAVAVDFGSEVKARWREPNPHTDFGGGACQLPSDACNDPALEPEMESFHLPRPIPKLNKPDA